MANERAILETLFDGKDSTHWPLSDSSPAANYRAGVNLLIVHSDRDANVFASQGVLLFDALKQGNPGVRLRVYPGSEHGDLWRERADSRVSDFLHEKLGRAKTPKASLGRAISKIPVENPF